MKATDYAIFAILFFIGILVMIYSIYLFNEGATQQYDQYKIYENNFDNCIYSSDLSFILDCKQAHSNKVSCYDKLQEYKIVCNQT